MNIEGQAQSARRAKFRDFRRPLLAAFAAIALALIVFAILRAAPGPALAAPLAARLELAAGEVLVDQGSGSQRMLSGTALLEKARVSTGRGARALIRLSSGASLFLRGDTEVALDKQRVSLERGESWLEVPASGRASAPYAVGDSEVAASDAGLSIRRVGAQASVYIARGTASVRAKQGRIEASAGEQIQVGEDGVPRRSPVAFWEDWTGGMADWGSRADASGSGAGRMFAVDDGAPAGAPVEPLDLSQQSVRAVLREGLSETEVDQTFFNPGERQVEGWYWFSLPADASVSGFAVETDGRLVEGEFIERREAAAQYGAAKQSGHAPAILEYIDGRTYRARIFPIAAGGSRRLVLRYFELHPLTGGKVEYVYPMGEGQPIRIGEFSLTVDLGDAGKQMKISTLADARIEQGGSLVTMRRSGYTPRAPFQLEATLGRARSALRVARYRTGADSADYVLARYVPDVDWAQVKQPRADIVVVVDTSAGGDESSHRLKLATAEALLRALSDDDRFAVMTLDVQAALAYPKEKLAAASDKEIASALEALASHPRGGATDLSLLFDPALELLHGAEQPAIVYVGDGLATSGEMSAEQLVERLRRSLSTSHARFFAVAVGADSNVSMLSALSRAGGGVSLRVDESEQTTARALELTAAIKRPTITDFELDLGAGLDEVFSSATGKVSRGQEVTLLARTHHDLPSKAKVKGNLAGKPFEREYQVELDDSVASAFVPRLWAAENVRRLLGEGRGPDVERGHVAKLGIDYGLMTPFTSILALESDDAYEQMGIPRRRSPLRGVRLSALSEAVEERLRTGITGPGIQLAFGCSVESKSDSSPAAHSESSPTPANNPGQPVERAQEMLAAPQAAKAAAKAEAAPSGLDQLAPTATPAPEAAAASEIGLGSRALAAAAPAFAARAAPAKTPVAGLLSGPRDASGGLAGTTPRQGAKARAATTDNVARVLGTSPAKALLPLHCSDASAQPLALRASLWEKRLAAAGEASDLMARYATAKRACELSDWHAERVFLALLQKRIKSASVAESVLSEFADRVDVQKYLAGLILRRTVDRELIAAVQRRLFGSDINWLELDLKLQTIASPDERLAKLREYAARVPNDPNGSIRLVRELLQSGARDEAVALGRKLHEDGLFTPELTRDLGELLSRAGFADEAIRTYSEIVEFDPENEPSRRLLGDTYLAHAWYEPAYRQYRVLVGGNHDDASNWLRLAAAAAGAGRVDEALRIERRVAADEGTPGSSDPRRWARLWSAARIARLLAGPLPDKDAPPERAASLERELKQLQLWNGPGSLLLLSWENLQIDLMLSAEIDGHTVELGDVTDAAAVGLSAALVTSAEAEHAVFHARRRGAAANAPVPLKFHVINWNEKKFTAHVTEAVLLPADLQATLVQ